MNSRHVGVAIGISMGLCFGATLGAAFQNIAIGVSFGVPLGTALGLAFSGAGAEQDRKKVAADKPLFTTIAQVGAAVASMEGGDEPVTVTSLQDYAIARAARA